MWHKILLVSMLVLAGCSSMGEQFVKDESELVEPGEKDIPDETQTLESPSLETRAAPTLTNLGPAPELTNDVWLNTAEPLRLANLRGKVVLIEMWTFG